MKLVAECMLGIRVGFPQLSSCGPIEAPTSNLTCFLSGKPFPQLSSCGPIEAAVPTYYGVSRRAFRNCQVAAPLKPPSWWTCSRGSKTFRNCQVAAPLKPWSAGGPGSTRPPFRNCQVAAPLKHITRKFLFQKRGYFPQLSSCGPIEAGRRTGLGRGGGTLSATVKLRPH